jgi:hypothetical protein
MSFVKHAGGIITGPTSWAKRVGEKVQTFRKLFVSIILMTPSPFTPQFFITVS